jgi:hypothetical protein
MTFKETPGYLKVMRKNSIALGKELSLEEGMDLSYHRLWMDE